MWSDSPAVQVLAWRLLTRLFHEGWAAYCLDLLHLEDDILTWANSGISTDDEGTPADIHRDSQGKDDIALAIFLGFRNTVSYERFREGRKLWGALLNDTRSLAQQVYNFIPNDVQHRAEMLAIVRQLATMAYALNHQIRGTDR